MLRISPVYTQEASVLFQSSDNSVGNMKSNMSRLLSVFIAVFIAQAVCQDRYIVEVVEYLKTNHNTSDNLCPATVITERHVLTTAACAKASSNLFDLAIEVPSTDATNTQAAKKRIDVDTVFIHPNYTATHSTINNIAVILLKEKLNTTALPPRTLGSIPADDLKNATCNLFGWDANMIEGASLHLFDPKFCISTAPEAYCSHQEDGTSEICSAKRGSPISCSPKSIDGILLNTGCTYDDKGRYLSLYHSVGDYKAWIESVSGAETTTALSMALFVSVIALSLKNLM